jgi:hypothetical protein
MKKHNLWLLLAGIAITVIGLIGYQFLVEKKVHVYFGFGLSFFCTVAVCLIGYSAWRKYPSAWAARIWVLVYEIYFGLFLAAMLTHRFVHPLPFGAIDFMHSIRDFLTSPVPLIFLYFLATKFIGVTSKVARG